MITYSQSHLLWCGILLFMMHLGSRRQLRHERLADPLNENLPHLCHETGGELVAD